MELGGSDVVYTNLTLSQHRTVAVAAAVHGTVRAGHRPVRRHQRVVELLDVLLHFRLGAGFFENCQQNMIG